MAFKYNMNYKLIVRLTVTVSKLLDKFLTATVEGFVPFGQPVVAEFL